MYCNTCFVSLRPSEHGVALSCGHLACPTCFQSVLAAKRCSVCSKSTDDPDMGWRQIAIPSGLGGPTELLQLAGNSVETCMSLSFAAIQFKCRQDELYAKLRYEKLVQKLQTIEAHYAKKISMMNQGYEDMKKQVESLRRERQEMEGDIRELRDKYGQKAKEAMNLRAQFSAGSSRMVSLGAGGSSGHQHHPHDQMQQQKQQARGMGGLPSLPPMGPTYTRAHPSAGTNSHASPSNLVPRTRSPHHNTARVLAYGHDRQPASPYATPAMSVPSMLVSSMPRSAHRTPHGYQRVMNPGGGGFTGGSARSM